MRNRYLIRRSNKIDSSTIASLHISNNYAYMLDIQNGCGIRYSTAKDRANNERNVNFFQSKWSRMSSFVAAMFDWIFTPTAVC